PVVPLAAALMRRPAHLAHGARDVGRHRLLVHLAALSLLAARAGARSVGAHAAARTTIITTGDAAAAATGRGGNGRPLVTGRGRGEPGTTGRGRGRSGVE